MTVYASWIDATCWSCCDQTTLQQVADSLLGLWLNCLPFRPDTRHKQEGSSAAEQRRQPVWNTCARSTSGLLAHGTCPQSGFPNTAANSSAIRSLDLSRSARFLSSSVHVSPSVPHERPNNARHFVGECNTASIGGLRRSMSANHRLGLPLPRLTHDTTALAPTIKSRPREDYLQRSFKALFTTTGSFKRRKPTDGQHWQVEVR